MNSPKITTIKARKAKHGFKMFVYSVDSLVAAGEVIKSMRSLDPDCIINYDSAWSVRELSLYTNDDQAAAGFSALYIED